MVDVFVGQTGEGKKPLGTKIQDVFSQIGAWIQSLQQQGATATPAAAPTVRNLTSPPPFLGATSGTAVGPPIPPSVSNPLTGIPMTPALQRVQQRNPQALNLPTPEEISPDQRIAGYDPQAAIISLLRQKGINTESMAAPAVLAQAEDIFRAYPLGATPYAGVVQKDVKLLPDWYEAFLDTYQAQTPNPNIDRAKIRGRMMAQVEAAIYFPNTQIYQEVQGISKQYGPEGVWTYLVKPALVAAFPGNPRLIKSREDEFKNIIKEYNVKRYESSREGRDLTFQQYLSSIFYSIEERKYA